MNIVRKIMFTAALLVGMAAIAPQDVCAQKRYAVVEFSTSYLRLKPDYESPLETQELMGTVVEIVGQQGYWREVITPQPYRAWCTDQGLVEMTEQQIQEYKAAPKVLYTQLYGHIYEKPSRRSATICDLVGGDLLRTVKKKGRWTQVRLPSGRTGFVPSRELTPHQGFVSIAQGEGTAESVPEDVTESIIGQAYRLLGSPYLWGGMSAKGVDCSGLVRISYLMNGILLPRNASQQINCGERIPMQLDRSFWEDRSDEQAFRNEMLSRVAGLERGDLVYFGTPGADGAKHRVTHVGIYLGDGRIIHSSHKVRVNSLIPGEADYYENAHRLLAATRL